LYYTSNKDGNFDIYKTEILPNGKFGKQIKLKNNINSLKDEISPFILNDKLYFSSNVKGGLGGYDIYSIPIDESLKKANRLEFPINSKYDDFCLVMRNSSQGFFNSNRPGGKGKQDIYSFTNLNPKVIAKKEISIATKKELEKETKLQNETIVIVKEEVNSKVKKVNPNISKPAIKPVIIKKSSPVVETVAVYNYCQMEFDKLRNVYFDYDKSSVRKDAFEILEKVIEIMKKCPNVKVIALSHTDSRASSEYNLNLSQERSMQVVNYIRKKGFFSKDRIRGVGYGEERLINGCADGINCKERQHQLNRRTHFEIDNY